jgi:putative transposase
MSRDLRIQYPGAWYHVMNRGLNRRRIFNDDSQRELFLEFLSDIHNRYGIEIHAYCLMDNHYHLLVHTPKGNISEGMRHLNSLYTRVFNRQEKRDGPLFRGRYKAILVEAEHYGLELSRYIHMNPIAAKICIHPRDYRWSSYKAYLRHAKKPHWLYCEEILLRCSEPISIKHYREFVEGNTESDIAEIFAKKQFPSALGRDEWIEQIKQRYVYGVIEDAEIYVSEELKQKEELEDIDVLIQRVIDCFGQTLEEFRKESVGRGENRLRNWFVYLAIEYGGYALKDVAQSIGDISISGVSQIKRRLHKKICTDKSLQLELERLRGKCGFVLSVKT